MMTFLSRMKNFLIYLTVSILLASCIDSNEEEVISPKPRAFYSLTFPVKRYKEIQTDCPFSFEIPDYAKLEPSTDKAAKSCWLNVKYPMYKAQLYLSYGEVNNNLPNYLKDARELAVRHQVKASGLEQRVILRDSAKVYGLLYDIEGNTASAVQFYVTDSTKNFLRGSLYFNCPPNIDSLQIVIDYLRQDVLHMIQTFKWKDQPVNDSKH
jgi:gliding motility-associated lipoprotein GldD